MFVFGSAVDSSSPVSAQTRTSEYRLTDDGRFTLWYPSTRAGYRGTYSEADGVISFTRGAIWAATGLLRDRTLTVRYNFVAQLEGFEDAVYTLKD